MGGVIIAEYLGSKKEIRIPVRSGLAFCVSEQRYLGRSGLRHRLPAGAFLSSAGSGEMPVSERLEKERRTEGSQAGHFAVERNGKVFVVFGYFIVYRLLENKH